MLIHSYFTDGMFNWATLFLQSFKFHNGEELPIVFDTKDITDGQIKELKSIYSNLYIYNEKIDMKKLAKRANINEKTLVKYRKQTETNKVNSDNKVWKLMIAADDRIKTVNRRLNELPEGDHLLHFDIDTFFVDKIDKMIEMTKKNDFITGYRIEKITKRFGKVIKERETRATLIYVMGFTNNEKSKKFMSDWINLINDTEPTNRKKGFGQSTCYHAYLKNKDKFKTEDVRVFHGKIFKSGNKGSKDRVSKKFRKKFEKTKGQ